MLSSNRINLMPFFTKLDDHKREPTPARHLTLSCLAGALTCIYMGISIYRKLKEKR